MTDNRRYGTMSSMKQLDQKGIIDAWFLGFMVTLLLFLGSVGFGVWAFQGMQKYKGNVDPLIADAVTKAVDQANIKKDNAFLEKEKNPLRTYTGPSAYGSIAISYPKTWSAYVDETGKGSLPLDGSFNPSFVPGLQSQDNVSLRVQVINQAYADVLRSFQSQVKNGTVTVVPYSIAKVPSVTGVRVDGAIVDKKQGAMVVVPLRDKTLKIWTEASQYVGDFNGIVLPNLSLVP